jgi:hypothetical protein
MKLRITKKLNQIAEINFHKTTGKFFDELSFEIITGRKYITYVFAGEIGDMEAKAINILKKVLFY